MDSEKLKAHILYKAQLFDIPLFQNETLIHTLLECKKENGSLEQKALYPLLRWLLESQKEAQLSLH